MKKIIIRLLIVLSVLLVLLVILGNRYRFIPIGADNPEVFQRNYPINNMDYTNLVAEFYPLPGINNFN